MNDRFARLEGKRTDITVTERIDKYIAIQDERLKNNELRPKSYLQKNKPLRLFREHCGMAQVVRMVLIDVFKEAQHLRKPEINATLNGQQEPPQSFMSNDRFQKKFREQEVDIQKLLGHKSRKIPDKYNDDRGKDWIVVEVKTG